MFAIHSITRLAPAAFALALISSIASALEAAGVLRRSAAAMGATELKSIRYTTEGTGYTFGQAFKPGMQWPKINVHSQVRTITAKATPPKQ